MNHISNPEERTAGAESARRLTRCNSLHSAPFAVMSIGTPSMQVCGTDAVVGVASISGAGAPSPFDGISILFFGERLAA